nr:glycoside hydrolase family 28 protein [Clostridia bacterium]
MLKTFSYNDTIVLFWNKSVKTFSDYEILLDGKRIGESKETFFRIKGLEPDTLYTIAVRAKSESGETTTVKRVRRRTQKQKRDICISDYPYCAVGDGETLNTVAIQRAVDDCGKNERVVIPKGVFLTGALRLHSNVELYIEKGGILKGSEKKEDYLPIIRSRFEGWECDGYSSLINVGVLGCFNEKKVHNVVIRGEGKIIGGGEELLYDILGIKAEDGEEKRRELLRYQENLCADKEGKHRLRGRLVNISNAENVIIDGLELGNAPSWNVHMIYSKNVITCGCRIFSKGIWNGDGWDPDSSENCSIFDCEFDTGDDCIAIKSGKNPEGNIIGKPTKNINIFACSIKKGRSHGVAIGSEVSGGIKGVNIWDCDFSNSFFGIHVKTTAKRGGYIKNVQVKDSKISRVMIRKVGYNDDGEGCKELTEISGLKFENLKIEYNSGDPNFGKEADSYVYINGFSQDNGKVKNIEFNNIEINNKENLQEYDLNNCFRVKIDGNRIM